MSNIKLIECQMKEKYWIEKTEKLLISIDSSSALSNPNRFDTEIS